MVGAVAFAVGAFVPTSVMTVAATVATCAIVGLGVGSEVGSGVAMTCAIVGSGVGPGVGSEVALGVGAIVVAAVVIFAVGLLDTSSGQLPASRAKHV